MFSTGVSWYEANSTPHSGTLGTSIAIGHSLSRLVVGITATTYLIVQVTSMTIFFAEEYIRKQKERRYQEAVTSINQEWEDWLKRKEEALAKDEEFTELSPAEKTKEPA